MEIDIIEYSDEQLARMTHQQRMRVYEAQVKKNKLLVRLQEQIRRERDNLVENGIFHSGIFTQIKMVLEERFKASCEAIQERLIYEIARDTGAGDASGVPYEVDYTLSYDDRYIVVRDYYLNTYSDAVKRFNAFVGDAFALTYLGDLYGTLYDYLYVLAYS